MKNKIEKFFSNAVVKAIINIVLFVTVLTVGGTTLNTLYHTQTSAAFAKLIIASTIYFDVIRNIIDNAVSSIVEAVDYISSIIKNKKGCVA